MKTSSLSRAFALCSAILATGGGASGVFAESTFCPKVSDQFVAVQQGIPVEIHLDVQDLGDAEVSIFSYPLRGILEHTGPTVLDYVFVAADNFNGTTSFTYRVDPSTDCLARIRLGRVTLAGGTAAGTESGLVPNVDPGICGIGLMAPALVTCGLISLRARQRRKARRSHPF